jgi:serine/threonine protein kinase
VEQAPWLDELALAVADGRPIDWHAQGARLAADIDPDLIAPFRLVERVVRAHREATFDIELESMTVRPAAGRSGAEESSDAVVTWGPLTIAERIGGGSYGDVYRAHDRRLDRTVALKLLRRRDSAQARRASAVIEEGRLMARVRHPNVVTVYGAERIDGRVGLWMEYLEGRTLAEELRISGPFAEDAIVEVASALCGALAAVHAAGLLHHDLKAQNVIRTTDGRIVLTDFGAGRQVMTDAQTAGSRQLRGTPAYLAPEILNGQPASLQSEVYSLGVLLYYLATGMFPDRTASPGDIRLRLSEQSACSALLSSLISRCLAPNQADRFKAMTEVAEAVNPMTDKTFRIRMFFKALKTQAWLWLLPTLIGFGSAAIWSAQTPDLYRSTALISLEPPKISANYVPDAHSTAAFQSRVPQIRDAIFNRTRLERIISDLDLYAVEREHATMGAVVDKMRSNIGVFSLEPQSIRISFTAEDPRQAQRVADRLVTLFIDESMRGRRLTMENTDQFLEMRLGDMKNRLVKAEENLAKAQSGSSRGLLTAQTLELEVASDGYRKLLTQQQEMLTMGSLERSQIGETFKLIEPARVSEIPIGPARGVVKLIATFGGLAVGLILVALSSARASRPQAV